MLNQYNKNYPKISKKSTVYLSVFLFIAVLAAWLGKKYTEDYYWQGVDLPYSQIKPKIIELDLPLKSEALGGVIAADVDNDGKQDFIITKPGYIAVYSNLGKQIWTKQINIQITQKSEKNGLPGTHAPGVQAADIDGDRQTEVLFLTTDNTLHIVQGVTGEIKKIITLKSPPGTERWEHLVVANFRGKGDRDLLLQATNAEGYRLGRHLIAYAIEDLFKNDNIQPLWKQNNYYSMAHNGARVADINGDGKDEVLGITLVGSDGKILYQLPIKLRDDSPYPQLDSIYVADVRPDIIGLEVVALEEGNKQIAQGEKNRIFLYNHQGLIWQNNFKRQEPQNAAIGDFDPNRPGLEIWCRSGYSKQTPYIFDANGQLIADYKMADVAPRNWTTRGIEVIFKIDWTGDQKQLAAAKERHRSGDVAIFEPMTGQFLYRFPEKSDRLYVADVYGDWREELIVLNGNRLHIYQNPEPNTNPQRPQLWQQNHYRRSKMTWNYYSP